MRLVLDGLAGDDKDKVVTTNVPDESRFAARALDHVVQEHAPGQRGRGPAQSLQHQQGVDPDVALGVPLRFLRAADQGTQLGKHLVDDAELQRECEAERRT